MAAFEVIALDTATPQLRAPGASDTYTFPRAVEMPLGTANGVLYLNGSKVVTSGSALTFDGTGLSVTGTSTATLKLNGRAFDNGSSANFYDNTGATRYGFIYFDASAAQIASANTTPLAFLLNGSEQMRLDSTGLGIGTSSPVGKLDTRGTAYLGSDSNNSLVVDSTSSLVTIAAAGRTAFSTSALRFLTSDGTAALERMRIDSSGNLGIGTTLPFTRTDSASSRSTTLNSIAAFNTMAISATDTTPFAVGVGGGINFRAQLSSTSYSTYAAIWSFRESATTSDYKGSLIFGTSDNNEGYPEERARIDSGGNVVIGTAALATNATNGFLYVPTCAGTPTGTPTTQTGTAPIVVDTTNNKLYFYSGGQWRDAGP